MSMATTDVSKVRSLLLRINQGEPVESLMDDFNMEIREMEPAAMLGAIIEVKYVEKAVSIYDVREFFDIHEYNISHGSKIFKNLDLTENYIADIIAFNSKLNIFLIKSQGRKLVLRSCGNPTFQKLNGANSNKRHAWKMRRSVSCLMPLPHRMGYFYFLLF